MTAVPVAQAPTVNCSKKSGDELYKDINTINNVTEKLGAIKEKLNQTTSGRRVQRQAVSVFDEPSRAMVLFTEGGRERHTPSSKAHGRVEQACAKRLGHHDRRRGWQPVLRRNRRSSTL